MRIVVAGVSGFVGGHVLDELVRHDVDVIGILAAGEDPGHLEELDAELVEADVLDRDALRLVCGSADFVINAVELTSPGLSDAEYDDVNVGGTTSLLDVAVEAEVRGFVHISSTVMYGDALPDWPVNEGWAFRPLSSVEQSRAMAERAARTYRRRVPLVVARPALAFGPRDSGVMSELLLHFIDQRRPRIISAGSPPVSLSFGPDLGRAIWGLIDHIDRTVDGIFHVKSIDTDWRTVVDEVQDLLHRPRRTQPIPYRLATLARQVGVGDWLLRPPADVANYVALTGRPHLIDDSRFLATTGFEPLYGLRAALRSTLESLSADRASITL
jgi:nucleoside-diphosphate-sugar epimerase